VENQSDDKFRLFGRGIGFEGRKDQLTQERRNPQGEFAIEGLCWRPLRRRRGVPIVMFGMVLLHEMGADCGIHTFMSIIFPVGVGTAPLVACWGDLGCFGGITT
jgi:hypothetical protein